MTGLEKLRAICGLYCLTGGGVQPVAIDKLQEIADQIDCETLPRPRFEDGEPVQFGDEVLVKCPDGDFCGELYQVAFDGEEVTLTNIDGEIVHITQGQRVKRPEPPDTWERIEADANMDTCDYNGDECQATMCSDCQLKHRLEIVRRCKALAGVK